MFDQSTPRLLFVAILTATLSTGSTTAAENSVDTLQRVGDPINGQDIDLHAMVALQTPATSNSANELPLTVMPSSDLSDWKFNAEQDILADRDNATLASSSAIAGSLKISDAKTDSSPMRTLFAMMAIFGLLAGGMGCLQLARW